MLANGPILTTTIFTCTFIYTHGPFHLLLNRQRSLGDWRRRGYIVVVSWRRGGDFENIQNIIKYVGIFWIFQKSREILPGQELRRSGGVAAATWRRRGSGGDGDMAATATWRRRRRRRRGGDVEAAATTATWRRRGGGGVPAATAA